MVNLIIQMLNQTAARLSGALGRLPTTTELADRLKIDPATCERALRALDQPVSLDAAGGDGDAPLSGAVPDPGVEDPETLALDAAARKELGALLSALPAWERMILRGRLGMAGPPQTFEELPRTYAVSSARVRQLYRAALSRLRHTARVEGVQGRSHFPIRNHLGMRGLGVLRPVVVAWD